MSELARRQGLFESLSFLSDNTIVASGYLKVLRYEQYETDKILLAPKYERALTNYEVKVMFKNMVRGWFGRNLSDYNDFIKALLLNDLVKSSQV